MIKKLFAGLAVAALVVAGGSQVAVAGNHNDWVKLTFEKEWVVTEDPDTLFNKDDVDVAFDVKVYRNHDLKHETTASPGDKIWVKKGSFVVVEENVEGLNELCDYSADGLKRWVKWGKKHQTQTVTNTVTCESEPEEEPEEEEEGVVLSTATTTPPATLPKTGKDSAALVAIASVAAAGLLVASATLRRAFLKS